MEMPRQVTLIGKAGAECDGREWQARSKKVLGAIDPQLRLICVRGHSDLHGKHTVEMKRAQVGQRPKGVERDGSRKIILDVPARFLDGDAFRSLSRPSSKLQ